MDEAHVNGAAVGAITNNDTKSSDASADTETFARLAKLSPPEYDREREAVAKQLGIRISTLDREVDGRRSIKPGSSTSTTEDTGILAEVEPWPHAVEGAEVLGEIVASLERFTVLPDGGALAIALWVLFAHAHDAAEHSPILALESPEKRCGKTTTLSLVADLVPRHLPAANISPAALFRAVEKYRPTLLIDEGDSFLRGDNEEMRGILNSGFTSASAFVIRCEGDDHDPRPFRTWCPKLIALIGTLPDTLQDRSVVVTLRRKLDHEKVDRFTRHYRAELHTLRAKAARWAGDHYKCIAASDPTMPAGLNDRAQDCWRPLLAIADLIGGCWPASARKSAAKLTGKADDDESASAGVLLLGHVREVFNAKRADRITSTALVEALNDNEAWPWGEWRQGKPISPRGVAKILLRYGVKAHKARNANEYRIADFADAWSRYAPPTRGEPPTASSTSSTRPEYVCRINGLSRGKTPFSSSTSIGSVEHEKPLRKPVFSGFVEEVELAPDSVGQWKQDAPAAEERDDEIEVQL
jgi:putative DNA primase/helicase